MPGIQDARKRCPETSPGISLILFGILFPKDQVRSAPIGGEDPGHAEEIELVLVAIGPGRDGSPASKSAGKLLPDRSSQRIDRAGRPIEHLASLLHGSGDSSNQGRIDVSCLISRAWLDGPGQRSLGKRPVQVVLDPVPPERLREREGAGADPSVREPAHEERVEGEGAGTPSIVAPLGKDPHDHPGPACNRDRENPGMHGAADRRFAVPLAGQSKGGQPLLMATVRTCEHRITTVPEWEAAIDRLLEVGSQDRSGA